MEINALTTAASNATSEAQKTERSPSGSTGGRAAFPDAAATALAERAAGDAVAERARPADNSGWKQLETLLVQQMLQTMMSSEEGGFFGKELGSDYYASFMAEQFATRLSEGLDLGIASRLDRHYGSGDDR